MYILFHNIRPLQSQGELYPHDCLYKRRHSWSLMSDHLKAPVISLFTGRLVSQVGQVSFDASSIIFLEELLTN